MTKHVTRTSSDLTAAIAALLADAEQVGFNVHAVRNGNALALVIPDVSQGFERSYTAKDGTPKTTRGIAETPGFRGIMFEGLPVNLFIGLPKGGAGSADYRPVTVPAK